MHHSTFLKGRAVCRERRAFFLRRRRGSAPQREAHASASSGGHTRAPAPSVTTPPRSPAPLAVRQGSRRGRIPRTRTCTAEAKSQSGRRGFLTQARGRLPPSLEHVACAKAGGGSFYLA
ncbi:hypothetical protein AAFF_G00139110 [Aldrovandia affinis]|uniref:Uncharacterized protein n=1 Tax=Aldrovandia affinis TaxID=143900 RepID=A0AAD7TC17_9TELE|nr:hypothetical protein AAFF_G00139110 [Aldrovandia affinis]